MGVNILSFKNLQQVYALFICLICMIVLLISSGNFLDELTRLTLPAYRNAAHLIHFQSNEAYLKHLSSNPTERAEAKLLSAEELKEKRIEARQYFLDVERFKAIESLIKTIQWALVAFVFFLIHWRLYKKSGSV
ncbi:hypothetical protein IM40_08805 [Candidatus Paracaedimonas acanthamoebae]|nr:hypothetical protein IM40_08805 [Candidatus Paracaedimonas acanthamoebae]